MKRNFKKALSLMLCLIMTVAVMLQRQKAILIPLFTLKATAEHFTQKTATHLQSLFIPQALM